MSCNRPLKGFQDGLTKNGKPNYIITSYKVHHIEISKGKYKKCFDSHISPDTDRCINTHIEIPCGVCLSCRLDHARLWSDRILMEMNNNDDNCFITLTYDDNHLPKSSVQCVDDTTGEVSYSNTGCYQTLDIKDLQRFIQNLRNLCRRKYKKTIKYFACGEYGSQSMRPHYHIIVFGFNPTDLVFYGQNELGDIYYNSRELSNCWLDIDGNDKGFVVVGEATKESAQYVARYTVKKLKDMDSGIYDELGIKKEFITMSKGISKEYYETNKDTLFKQNSFYLPSSKGARKCKTPRYFKKLLERDDIDYFTDLKEMSINYKEDFKNKILESTDKPYLDVLENQEVSLNKRTQILKERSKV